MVLAAVPISGAVGDQDNNVNNENAASDLKVGVSSEDIQDTQTVLQNKKPFGENSTNKILGNNTTNGELQLGSSGDKVKELQQWLTDYGYYSGDIDGVYGEDTETAVKNFQEEAGLIVDGVVGSDTKKAMKNWDEYVAQVQAAAGESDYTSDSDSSSNSREYYASAVRSYSQSYSYSNSYSSSWSSGKGTGDCWDNSAALYSSLSSSGTKARIVQYSNSYSSNHRSVEVWNGNSWVDYDYKSNGYAQRYYATAHSSSSTVIASS